jgi:hypothetical protein
MRPAIHFLRHLSQTGAAIVDEPKMAGRQAELVRLTMKTAGVDVVQ